MQISDAEISSTFQSLDEVHRQKLNSFYQLRSLFAPLIEGLVLLDRLVFLLEQVGIIDKRLNLTCLEGAMTLSFDIRYNNTKHNIENDRS